MQVTVEIPDELVSAILPGAGDVSRLLLEEAVAAAYRQRRLTMQQVADLLGFPTRLHADSFLQRHDVYDYTPEDLSQDLAVLNDLTGDCSHK